MGKYILYSLVLMCYLKMCVWGGGNVFLALYAISNISIKKIGNTFFLESYFLFNVFLVFSSCFFMLDLFPRFLEFLWKY